MGSCGGGNSSSGSKSGKFEASVSLDDFDDYFTVESWKIESNIQEITPQELENYRATITLVVKRNKEEMKYKPSDILGAEINGDISSSFTYLFRGDCDAIARKMVKMEPGSKEEFVFKVSGCEPFNEEKFQLHYDALLKGKSGIEQITLDVLTKQEIKEDD